MLTFTPIFVAAVAVLGLVAPAHADPGAPTATSVAERVYQLAVRLDEVAAEFGFEPGESPAFEQPRFNRLLREARRSLDLAIRHVDQDRVCVGFFKVARSV